MMNALIVDLIPVWVVIIALSVFLYVLLDGFDLGVGMLYGLAPEKDRPMIMNAIAPVWDGNETWLILGAVALLAVFPLAFAIVIPAVYFPILIMLLALVFRGWPSNSASRNPGCITSGTAALPWVRRWLPLRKGRFWAPSSRASTSRAGVCGLLVGLAHTLFGDDRTGPDVRLWPAGRRLADHQDRGRSAGMGAHDGAACPDRGHAGHFGGQPVDAGDGPGDRRALVHPAPCYVAGTDPLGNGRIAILCWRALKGHGPDVLPFFAGLGLFLLSYLGVAISLWPMIVPHHYTLWQASSAVGTQMFLLIGTLVLLPVILMYTGWSYWVFRGKLKPDVGYH
jgi:cytochrome d ubiquinol oxidase subunit II